MAVVTVVVAVDSLPVAVVASATVAAVVVAAAALAATVVAVEEVAVALATVAAVEEVAVLLAADVVVLVAVPVVERKSNPKCSATIPTNSIQQDCCRAPPSRRCLRCPRKGGSACHQEPDPR